MQVPVLRANHTFRAIPLEAGRHSVVFRFEPASLAAGFWIYTVVASAVALYGLALGWSGWRSRSQTA